MTERNASNRAGRYLAGCAISLLLITAVPAVEDDVVTISVVTTNDFHGWIQGHGIEGGAHWLQGYLDIVRAEHPGRVLHLDAGDTWEGALISDYFDFAPAIEILNLMDVAALGFGNHELATGIESFQNVGNQLDCPLLAGNVFYRAGYRPPGERGLVPPLKRFVIQHVAGVKIGLIGALDPSAVAYFGPGSWVNKELYFADSLKTVRRSLRKTWRRGARFNIVITHIASSPDYQPEILRHLVCKLNPKRVHLVVTGHLHVGMATEVCGIPVVQAWDHGTAFSRIDFDVDRRSGRVIGYRMNQEPTRVIQSQEGSPATYQRWDTGEFVEVSPDLLIQERVEFWEEQLAAAVNDVIGHTNAAMPSDRRRESVVGDWVADRFREALEYQVDFVAFRGGSEIDAGDITLAEILTTFPFNNEIIIIELTGEEVLQVLEEGITTAHYGLLQVSGLQYVVDYDRPDGEQLDGEVIDTNTYLPIDPTATYLMATTNYLANGAQGMDTMVANPQQETEIHFRDYLIGWLPANSPFDPPDPAVEERITVYGDVPD
jgi:2',3'-cyclic-nucleotide 2'-phosphodiesterase (5'-nucleotidase family)